MARVGYLANNIGEFSPTMKITADNLMGMSGLNIGNFAFWNAVQLLLDEEIILFPFGSKPDEYIGKLDFIVIPAANWLNAGQDFGWLATFIEEVDVPCLIFGLGAQSETEEQFPSLKEGTLRFLSALSKRTPFLAVRGEYTKNFCNHLGIKNVEALGCPSILTSPNKELGKCIKQRWETTIDKVAIHGLNLKHNTHDIEPYLFNILNTLRGSSYIIQEPRYFIRIMTQEELSDKDRESLQQAHQFLNSNLSYDNFIKQLRESCYVPYSLNSWVNYISYHSHSIGTRIHGSIISLTAEIPSICVTHDTRTKELCEIMEIPNLPCNTTIFDQSPIQEIFSQVTIHASKFDANRKYLARKNSELIKQAGLTTSRHLNSLL